MPLAAGSKLSFYEVLGPLGAGAMGEVYRARDTKLGREVAIKVLPEHFADDEERLRRFEREAKTLATLNHPNVAQIHGVDQVGDTCFLVLELVPGESLAERLERGPLPLDEALDVCRQIAEGLEAAHEAGVIHRDLKPANIRVTPEGKVKVLDFGLAKPAGEGRSGSSTDSVLSTEAGRLLGTPTYMAPEQARGKPIDKRVDIWAFGCVLYECLSARRAFEGETLTDVFAAVIEREPDWKKLPAATPPHVRALLARCCAKDPRQRLRDVGEARLELARPRAEPETSAARTRGAKAPSLASARIPWALCALFAGAAAFFALRAPPQDDASSETTGRRFALPRARDGASFPLLAPDGRHLVSAAEDGLWLRALDEPVARRIEGTQGGSSPFWAPDGRQLGFFAGGKLKRVAVSGAPPEVVADAPSGWASATWSSDGTILFEITESTDEEGWYVLAPGASRAEKIRGFRRERAVGPDKTFPCFLPDGRHFLFTEPHEGKPYLQLGSLDSDEYRRLTVAESRAQYAAPGHVLYVRDGVLLAQGFDAEALELRGEPREVERGVYFHGPTGNAHFSVSQQGTLVLRRVRESTSLHWFDRGGRELETVLSGQRFGGLQLAPDGTRVAYSLTDARDGTIDLWLLDLERKLPTRLTSAARSEYGPCWDPTGRFLAFSADWNGPPNLHLLDVAQGTTRELTPSDRLVQSAGSWTPDGATLAYSSNGPRGVDLWSVDIASGERRELLATEFNENDPRISPDGKRVAFVSDSSGRPEIYLMSFPGGGERVRLSVDGGYEPQWNADGSELFFVYDDALLSMSLVPGGDGRLRAEPPAVLFRLAKNSLRSWCVTQDGQRFLIGLGSPEDAYPVDDVLVDWPRLLAN